MSANLVSGELSMYHEREKVGIAACTASIDILSDPFEDSPFMELLSSPTRKCRVLDNKESEFDMSFGVA
jgi:hypothetical protein